MDIPSAIAIFSIIGNAFQYMRAVGKDIADYHIQKLEIKNKFSNAKAERVHDLAKIQLNNENKLFNQLFPTISKACTQYVALTKLEMGKSSEFPVQFSDQQQELEAEVLLYFPSCQQVIDNFNATNSPTATEGSAKLLERTFPGVIKSLSECLMQLHKDQKQSK